MNTNQTPKNTVHKAKMITCNTWNKLVDRIRRRIAFVPEVDDTVKSLKDVGIELKDNQP
jgi:aspartate/glutamate racemase